MPSRVTQRFNALAGLIQIADREFQAIYNENTNIEKDVRKRVEAGQFEDIELNAVSLRAFLDWRLGPDRHVSPYSYRWMVRILRGLRDLDWAPFGGPPAMRVLVAGW